MHEPPPADNDTGGLDRDVIEHARALMERGPRQLLGIVGAPGAGKSTLAETLVSALGPAAQLLPMDGYHLSNRELQRLARSERKGAPDTFDAHGYLALLQRLRTPRAGETVYAPGFYRDIEEPIAASIGVPPSVRLVVTEGNYLLLDHAPWSAIADTLDETWYLHVDPPLRRQRLVARHVRFGRSPPAARDWVASVDEPNAALIAASRPRASRVLTWQDGPDARFVPDTDPAS
ncbi:nucleoside/nucleotide kinase family protein [Arhodomonas sp. AD133]|uniref:nucleoside/nucleotide kinase family protein n=1 Tax=Arhodomonas sp. AD133 TaxID=3415009 RepID=UPI003EBA255C